MRVIIIGAGTGKRINVNEKNTPKCLLKINSKSILENQISLLQIDAESYDYHILVQMFNSKVRPGIVNFEVKMMSDNEKEFVVDRFVQEGYKLYRHGIDLMAYKV